MKTELAAFLEKHDGRPVKWGDTDCSAIPHKWLATLGFEIFLPVYRSRDEAHGIIEKHGSLVATWDWCLAQSTNAPGERTDDPMLGDIAVIDTRLYRQIGGILAAGNILIVMKDDGRFQWFGPVRRFAKVWAAS
jgi:hypothetical protein